MTYRFSLLLCPLVFLFWFWLGSAADHNVHTPTTTPFHYLHASTYTSSLIYLNADAMFMFLRAVHFCLLLSSVFTLSHSSPPIEVSPDDTQKTKTKTKEERREKKKKKNTYTLAICQDSPSISVGGRVCIFKNQQNRQARQKSCRHCHLPRNIQELELLLDQGLERDEGGVVDGDEIS